MSSFQSPQTEKELPIEFHTPVIVATSVSKMPPNAPQPSVFHGGDAGGGGERWIASAARTSAADIDETASFQLNLDDELKFKFSFIVDNGGNNTQSTHSHFYK